MEKQNTTAVRNERTCFFWVKRSHCNATYYIITRPFVVKSQLETHSNRLTLWEVVRSSSSSCLVVSHDLFFNLLLEVRTVHVQPI